MHWSHHQTCCLPAPFINREAGWENTTVCAVMAFDVILNLRALTDSPGWWWAQRRFLVGIWLCTRPEPVFAATRAPRTIPITISYSHSHSHSLVASAQKRRVQLVIVYLLWQCQTIASASASASAPASDSDSASAGWWWSWDVPAAAAYNAACLCHFHFHFLCLPKCAQLQLI